MNDNRKLSLGLVSILAIIMTSMMFLYRQPSPFWISSQVFLLMGSALFLGMALFLYDARNIKLFALPGAMIAIGELFAVGSQFRLLGGQGVRIETAGGQPIELLVATLCALQFVVLAWAVIDISIDFPFCDMTCLMLAICLGFSAAVDLVSLSFSLKLGMDAIRMHAVSVGSDLLSLGTVVVFYFAYTGERRKMYRYYRAQAAEQKRANRQIRIAQEEQAKREQQEAMQLEQDQRLQQLEQEQLEQEPKETMEHK